MDADTIRLLIVLIVALIVLALNNGLTRWSGRKNLPRIRAPRSWRGHRHWREHRD